MRAAGDAEIGSGGSLPLPLVTSTETIARDKLAKEI